MKNHYVYQIKDRETDQFYIGSRSCDCEPEEDSYMGSPCAWKPNEENLDKYVLFKGFSDRDSAFAVERATIKEFINDELNENYHIPSEGFHNHGKRVLKSTKDKISKTLTGYKHSKETKRKLSKIHQDCNLTEIHKYSIDGQYLSSYKGIKYAIKDTNANKTNIIRSAKTNNKTSGGYRWRYNKLDKLDDIQYDYGKHRRKKVHQYSLDGEYLNSYCSIINAAKENNLLKENISACCRNKANTTGGYQWSYKKKSDIGKPNYANKNPVVKFDLEGNFIKKYDSINKATKNNDVSRQSISHCVNGRRNKGGGFKWKYLEDYEKDCS